MAQTDLATIRTKVRRLTFSAAPAQLSDTDIDQYINTFMLYDMPMHLRQWNLRKTFTWYTEPNIDTYRIDTPTIGDQFYDFINLYTNIYQPVYIGGYQTYYTQSRQELFNMYPQVRAIAQVGSGDGVTLAFSGTLQSIPVALNSVLFDSVITIGGFPNGLRLSDDGVGNLVGDGTGTINYITGAFTLNFSVAPDAGATINSQSLPYVAARPQTLCFYDNTIILRPIPDQVYAVNFEVDTLPTELINSSQNPDIKQWWQYIAYGAAKKVLEDRRDMEAIQQITPEYEKQEALVERRTLIQLANQRSSTIYVTQSTANGNFGGWGSF